MLSINKTATTLGVGVSALLLTEALPGCVKVSPTVNGSSSDGTKGATGATGADGTNGVTGPTGATGATGAGASNAGLFAVTGATGSQTGYYVINFGTANPTGTVGLCTQGDMIQCTADVIVYNTAVGSISNVNQVSNETMCNLNGTFNITSSTSTFPCTSGSQSVVAFTQCLDMNTYTFLGGSNSLLFDC